MKEKVHSVDNTITNDYYETCVLEDDYTLSFEYDEGWRGGGAFLTKENYKEHGKTYLEAVQKYMECLKNSNPEYYKKIRKMIHKNLIKTRNHYYRTVTKKAIEKIKIINGREYIDKFNDSLKTVQFAKQVIERLRYEVHDLYWKQAIDEALKRITEDERKLLAEGRE